MVVMSKQAFKTKPKIYSQLWFLESDQFLVNIPAISEATNQCFLIIVVASCWRFNEPKFQVNLNWKYSW